MSSRQDPFKPPFRRLAAAAFAVSTLIPAAALAAEDHPSVTIEKRSPPAAEAPSRAPDRPSEAPFAGVADPASARSSEAGFQVGTLTCETKASASFGFKSKRDASCEYRPMAGRHAVDLYLGRIGTVGVDVGSSGPSVMTWAVIAHSADLGPGDLAGKYRGASASVAALIGGGANILVGGSSATVSLQPLSVQGQTGFNLSAGYASLTLDPI